MISMCPLRATGKASVLKVLRLTNNNNKRQLIVGLKYSFITYGFKSSY